MHQQQILKTEVQVFPNIYSQGTKTSPKTANLLCNIYPQFSQLILGYLNSCKKLEFLLFHKAGVLQLSKSFEES